MEFTQNVIDSHLHLRGLVNADGCDMYTFFDTVQKKHNLKALNLCACPIAMHPDSGNWGVENNILTALYKLHNPTAYAHGSLFYPEIPARFPMPEGMDFATQYTELMGLGFDGIKLLETKTFEAKAYNLRIDSPEFSDFFANCESDGTHIIWHVADPDTFWDIDRIPARHLARGWYYGDGSYPSWESIYESVFRVLDRFPKLNITFAHFFFWSFCPEKLEDLFARYENVSIDITPGAEMYGAFRENRDFYREFFIKYAHRILYGTDLTFCGSKAGLLRPEAVYRFLTTDEEITVVDVPTRGLLLPEDTCRQILWQNFTEATGAAPKPINRQLLKQYIEKYACFITQEDVRAHILEKAAAL